LRKKRPPWAGLLTGCCALAVYLATLSPTVEGGDSGEFIVVAFVRGIAHPPGYPLHALLGHLLTLLPLGTVAWRVNLLSAACDGLAAALLAQAVASWTGRSWPGVLSGVAFAFSPLVWPYAVTAEVFPLNNLFAAGLVLISVEATHRPGGWLPWAAFWLGLGLTNHHTLVFLGAPVVAYVLLLERGGMSPRRLALTGVGFAAGLVPYAYLPLAAAAHPPFAWGDLTSWQGFWTHLLRREYGTFRLASADVGAGGQLLPRLGHFVSRFARTTWGLGPFLALCSLGSFGTRSPRARLALLWSASLVEYLVVFGALANVRLDEPLHVTVQERFWQQALLVGCALAGVGLAALAEVLGGIGAVMEMGAALGLGVALLLTGLGPMSQPNRVLFRDYATAVLDSMPENAILLATSDETIGSVRYVQEVEGRRRDVRVIPSGQLASPWFRSFAARHLPGLVLPPGEFTALQFIEANAPHADIRILNKIPWLVSLEERYHSWPWGLTDRVLKRGSEPDVVSWSREATGSLERFDPGPADRFPVGSWERYLADAVLRQHRRFARTLPSVAAARGDDPAVHRAIALGLESLVGRDPQPEAAVLKNLGAAYGRLAGVDPSARAKSAFYFRRYLATHPTDPDADSLRRLIAADEAGGKTE
jgi:hypothetical protein